MREAFFVVNVGVITSDEILKNHNESTEHFITEALSGGRLKLIVFIINQYN
jgi:hypothetical protein